MKLNHCTEKLEALYTADFLNGNYMDRYMVLIINFSEQECLKGNIKMCLFEICIALKFKFNGDMWIFFLFFKPGFLCSLGACG